MGAELLATCSEPKPGGATLQLLLGWAIGTSIGKLLWDASSGHEHGQWAACSWLTACALSSALIGPGCGLASASYKWKEFAPGCHPALQCCPAKAAGRLRGQAALLSAPRIAPSSHRIAPSSHRIAPSSHRIAPSSHPSDPCLGHAVWRSYAQPCPLRQLAPTMQGWVWGWLPLSPLGVPSPDPDRHNSTLQQGWWMQQLAG